MIQCTITGIRFLQQIQGYSVHNVLCFQPVTGIVSTELGLKLKPYEIVFWNPL